MGLLTNLNKITFLLRKSTKNIHSNFTCHNLTNCKSMQELQMIVSAKPSLHPYFLIIKEEIKAFKAGEMGEGEITGCPSIKT